MIVLLVGASALFVNKGKAMAAGTTNTVSYTSLQRLDVTSFSAGAGVGVNPTTPDKNLPKDTDRSPQVANQNAKHIPLPTTAPSPTSQSLATSNPGAKGFMGLTHYDQRLANSGNQFSLEPPDQALCTDGHVVMEGVNTALAVYSKDGKLVSGPTAINPFFHLNAEIIRGTTNVFGQFTSDPKCYFDAQTHRWFVTILELDTDPATGANTGQSHTYLAVSQSSDPTKNWTIFSFNTTNDGTNGTPKHAGCPCLGDQPLLGADLFGLYITTNEFPLFSAGFNGAQVYAISKYSLADAAADGSSALPTVVSIDASQALAPYGGLSYSIQPMTIAPNSWYNFDSINSLLRNHGSEYFLSAFDFTGTLDNRIAVWSLSNTGSLLTHKPNLSLTFKVLQTETYGQPPNVVQKSGPTPLRDLINSGNPPVQEVIDQLNTNDDRMNAVTFANDHLYSAVNTVIGAGASQRTGIAYFDVRLGGEDSWNAKMAGQGYVSVATDSVFFPTFAANGSGKAALSFTIAGPNTYPSTGYVTFGDEMKASSVHITGIGAAPSDGFTGYVFFGGNGVARWGDYSAAVVAPDGSIWLAAEYIPNAPRTQLANWGTYITHLSTDN